MRMFTLKVVALLISLLLAAASKIVPKISNGVDAQITEFPYLVSIQRIDVHICSGTLLSERWILSSARCFATVPLAELNIEYGHSEISPGPNGLNKARISRVIAHEDFAGAINDISVSESDIPMITGFHVPFAKLTVPGGSRFSSGTVSVHAGWGHVSLGVRTTTLQKASTNILSFDECVEAVADTQKPARNNICAMSDSVICTSDLGNPLLINGVQVGIASFKNGPNNCENVDGGYPTVYTDVSYFIEWIEQNTGIDYQLNVFLQRNA